PPTCAPCPYTTLFRSFLAIVVLLRPEAKPAHVSPLAALRALAHPALRTLALTAIFYNFAFFVLLAYSPFPLEAAAAAHGAEFGRSEEHTSELQSRFDL